MRYRQLPLDQIAVTDRNIRKACSEEGMAELAASIEGYGLLQPIVVFEVGADRYEVVAGHRRLAACASLGWDSIAAMVTKSQERAGVLAQAQENLVREDMEIDEEIDVLAAAMQLVENAQREDLSQTEEGEALLRIAGGRNPQGGDRRSDQVSSGNLKVATLAALVGKSATWVSRRLSLMLDLPPDVRARVTHKPPTSPDQSPGIAVNTAAQIARLKGNEDVQRRLADKVEREGLTTPQTTAAVGKIKEDPDATEAVLAAKVDDSSFDVVTTRKPDRTPAKQPVSDWTKKPQEVVVRRFSQAYQNLCIALEPERLEQVQDAGRNAIAEVSMEVAEHACYMRTLLDNFIHDWGLEEKCGWTDSKAAEVASMEFRPSVVSLEFVDDEEAQPR